MLHSLKAEKRMGNEISKPKSFEEALKCEEQACAFLKEVVKANKQLKVVQAASEGIRGNIEVQETMSKLQARTYMAFTIKIQCSEKLVSFENTLKSNFVRIKKRVEFATFLQSTFLYLIGVYLLVA